MLKCFTAEYFQNRFNSKWKVKKIKIFYLSTEVLSCLDRHSVNRSRLFYFKVVLNTNFIMRSFISEFFNKLISLNFNVFSSCLSWILSDISHGVLICVFVLCRRLLFWIHCISSLPSWNYHWRMSKASTYSSIMHDVRWKIFLCLAIRILILCLLIHNSWCGREVSHLLI